MFLVGALRERKRSPSNSSANKCPHRTFQHACGMWNPAIHGLVLNMPKPVVFFFPVFVFVLFSFLCLLRSLRLCCVLLVVTVVVRSGVVCFLLIRAVCHVRSAGCRRAQGKHRAVRRRSLRMREGQCTLCLVSCPLSSIPALFQCASLPDSLAPSRYHPPPSSLIVHSLPRSFSFSLSLSFSLYFSLLSLSISYSLLLTLSLSLSLSYSLSLSLLLPLSLSLTLSLSHSLSLSFSLSLSLPLFLSLSLKISVTLSLSLSYSLSLFLSLSLSLSLFLFFFLSSLSLNILLSLSLYYSLLLSLTLSYSLSLLEAQHLRPCWLTPFCTLHATHQ